MPDTKISALAAASSLDGTEPLAIVQDGNTVKLTLADLAAWVKTAESITPTSLPQRGALVYRSSVLSIANNSATNISWNAEDYDTDAIWSLGAPTRLTVPTGVTKVRLGCGTFLPSATYTDVSLAISKNGGTGLDYPGVGAARGSTSATARQVAWTADIAVAAGDYFEARIIQVSSAARDLQINSWFAMRIIEATP